MSKKVGILTFHYARNYGATLQAYALQTKLMELCDEVEIIDYRNPEIQKGLSLWCPSGNGVKKFIYALGAFAYRGIKKLSFHLFNKKFLRLTCQMKKDELPDFVLKYDVLVTGSDQVWNPELTDGDKTYYLDIGQEQQLKLAYAASVGDAPVTLGECELQLLQKMDFISMREDNMREYIETKTGKRVAICCDPTLLLTSQDWKQLAGKRNIKRPYVFLFMIGRPSGLIQYAQNFAAEKNLVLVSNRDSMTFLSKCSPNDFLSWILNAEYVLTNSFHGTVFSILFEKQFLSQVINNDGSERSRIVNLLKQCGLEKRTLSNVEELDNPVVWSAVKECIETLRNESWTCVKESLSALDGGCSNV